MFPTRYCFEIIKRYEGIVTKVFDGEVRAVPYLDPVGEPTIGFGRLLTWSEYRHYKTTNGISMAEAEAFIIEDVSKFSRGVIKLIKVPLQDYQLDALVSFSYNVGLGNFKSSTLLKKLNNKDYLGAANEFPRWVYAKKKKLKGLVNRREAEKRMFLNKPPRSNEAKLVDAYFRMLLQE